MASTKPEPRAKRCPDCNQHVGRSAKDRRLLAEHFFKLRMKVRDGRVVLGEGAWHRVRCNGSGMMWDRIP